RKEDERRGKEEFAAAVTSGQSPPQAISTSTIGSVSRENKGNKRRDWRKNIREKTPE
ncbi:hypothetical protein A2U01_0091640, partial [Trifolium medium]|nr:hypothetical protein [Trifolium medium]